MPASPSSWFVDYTEESGFPSTEGPPTLGICFASTRWLEYRMTSTSMEFQDYVRSTESDVTVYTASTTGVPRLPSMSSLHRD